MACQHVDVTYVRDVSAEIHAKATQRNKRKPKTITSTKVKNNSENIGGTQTEKIFIRYFENDFECPEVSSPQGGMSERWILPFPVDGQSIRYRGACDDVSAEQVRQVKRNG